MAFVALGVTGGISAYKAVEVARGLQQQGHDVVAVMTANAQRFVGPLTFEAITNRAVVTDQFMTGTNANIEHIALASDIDLLLVAPATANVLGKFANGIADDFLSALYLATTAPVIVAPAMNTNMINHAAVKDNVKCLTDRGVRVVEAGEGYLACGWTGKGRLAEPMEIASAVSEVLSRNGSLVGRCVLVTAGPTYEDLDPVRFLGNRSSGRMGYAVAAEAIARGARVLLVSGPTVLEPPGGAEVLKVRSAGEMYETVMSEAPEADVVVMAAAVADYTPIKGRQPEKIQKEGVELTLTFARTQDILAELGQRRTIGSVPILVGFAAETSNLVRGARRKLQEKNLDFVVANNVKRPGAGFAVETNVATLVSDTKVDEVSECSKRDLARIILDRVEQCLHELAPVSND